MKFHVKLEKSKPTEMMLLIVGNVANRLADSKVVINQLKMTFYQKGLRCQRLRSESGAGKLWFECHGTCEKG